MRRCRRARRRSARTRRRPAARRPDGAGRARRARRRRARAAWCSCRASRSRPGPRARRASPARARVSSSRAASAATRCRSASNSSSSRSTTPLVGAEHLLFVVLERRRDEALAAGDRLLAVIVGGHGVQVRLRDLDVVAEHAIEAHLERVDAGARRARALPSRRSPACRSARCGAARRARGRRRRGRSRRRAPAPAARPGSAASIQSRTSARSSSSPTQALHQRRLALAEQRRARAASPPSTGAARRDRAARPSPSATRDVSRSRSWTPLERLAQLAAIGRAKRQLLDRVEPIANRLRARPAGGAATTRSSRPPITVTVRSISSSSDPGRPPSRRLDDLEVLERRRIDQQAVRRLLRARSVRTCARSAFCVSRR